MLSLSPFCNAGRERLGSILDLSKAFYSQRFERALRESLDSRPTKRLTESPDWKILTDARKRVVEDQIRKGVLNEVALKDAKREEFNKIEQQLRKLCRKFDENIMDATRKFEKSITDKTKMEGLSPRELDLAAQTAVSKGYENATAEDGPWVITLDEPNYHSFMGIAQNRALRDEIYRAYATRASSGDTDNTLIIDEILKLRLEKAKLLGYDNYVEVSMATKMATIDKAEEFLEKLRSASWDAAVQDMEDLKQFAKNQGAKEADDLSHWDIAFWTGRLLASKQEEHYIAIRKKKLRDDTHRYFSLPEVMEGLFNLARTLFGIEIEAADGLAPVWNNYVRFYHVKDSIGNPIAYFYYDPFSRPSEKRGGSWTSEVVGRSHVLSRDGASARLPIAIIVCNQTPALGNKPALITFQEVKVVFHEFGHALQHMLTEQDKGLVSGFRGIEDDAGELPSFFMENWCYHR
ncbi:organellar oligopeptidase A, chloroplastic/mitochondrial-like [Syzygium oleosum]|uniref:organellar oligopeptidase A, chloroplastic/mitochondrial-like n=1 Tax=Syzygium oleosum TaxID=219896 RepID=UPI0024B9734A|nr:organellar oligopeptidase A, chloroplastic/mitochondrial-like [Syzygium oleosum]